MHVCRLVASSLQSLKEEGGAENSPETIHLRHGLLWGCLHVLHIFNRRCFHDFLLQLLGLSPRKILRRIKTRTLSEHWRLWQLQLFWIWTWIPNKDPHLRSWSSRILHLDTKWSLTPHPNQDLSVSSKTGTAISPSNEINEAIRRRRTMIELC